MEFKVDFNFLFSAKVPGIRLMVIYYQAAIDYMRDRL